MNNILDISVSRNAGRKRDVVYTQEFFDALRKMADKTPQRCARCGVADGGKECKDGRLRKFPAVVRLCLIDATRAPNDIRNVALFCTRCRRPPRAWRTLRRMKPDQLPQLFVRHEALVTEPSGRVAA